MDFFPECSMQPAGIKQRHALYNLSNPGLLRWRNRTVTRASLRIFVEFPNPHHQARQGFKPDVIMSKAFPF